MLLPERVARNRQKLIWKLKENGIETTIGTWHIPLTTYFQTRYGYQPGDFSVADQVFARSLTLPLFNTLTEEQVLFVFHHLSALCQQNFGKGKQNHGSTS